MYKSVLRSMLFLFLNFVFHAFLYGQITFEHTYGGTNTDWGRSVVQTADQGYIVAGYTNSYGAGGYDVYLVKTDSLGDTLWTRTYGATNYDRGWSIQQTADGGYIIAGYTFSFGVILCDVYLIRTDPLGDTLWTRTYGASNDERGWSVCETQDKGYIIAGYTYSYGAGSGDVYLIKTDFQGNIGVEERNEIKNQRSNLILQVTPNLITHTAVIRYAMPRAGQVELSIYDALGKKVRSLVAGYRNVGIYQISWDGRNDSEQKVSSGVYVCRLKISEYITIKKMILLRK